MRVRNNLIYATHQFFQNHGMYQIHTPIITASDCEGAGEMFQVTTIMPKNDKVKDIPQTKEGTVDYGQDFFKRQANLTVSGQLNVEVRSLLIDPLELLLRPEQRVHLRAHLQSREVAH